MHPNNVNSNDTAEIGFEDLVCPICMSTAEDPYISSCCGRVFCKNDADENRYQNGCPLCRNISISFQPSIKHKEMMEILTIKCTCSQYIIPTEYESHLDRCSNVTFVCPHKSCQEKKKATIFNSQSLINHFARYHTDEVPILGRTYVNKTSLQKYKKVESKYFALVSTLHSVIYPAMIKIKVDMSETDLKTKTTLKCPEGHELKQADHTMRKREGGRLYDSNGYNCDVCSREYQSGLSWHCSCSQNGFDKCLSCVVFELYDIDNDTLKQANIDNVQVGRSREGIARNMIRLPPGLLSFLTQHVQSDDSDADNDDLDLFGLQRALQIVASQDDVLYPEDT